MRGILSRSSVDSLRAHSTPGLCDASDRAKLGIKGPRLMAWLAEQDVPCPQSIFEVTRSDGGFLAARVGSDEVVFEASHDAARLVAVEAALRDSPSGVYRVEQQTSTFLLSGPDASDFWAQTCALDIASAPTERILYTRVAGISCAVIPEAIHEMRAYRIWVDYSYGPELWKTMSEIMREL